jgi:hypothetical protein
MTTCSAKTVNNGDDNRGSLKLQQQQDRRGEGHIYAANNADDLFSTGGDEDDVHLMFSSDFIKGDPCIFNPPPESFVGKDTASDNTTNCGEMILGTMDEDLFSAAAGSMGHVQREGGVVDGRGLKNGSSFSNEPPRAVEAGEGFRPSVVPPHYSGEHRNQGQGVLCLSVIMNCKMTLEMMTLFVSF